MINWRCCGRLNCRGTLTALGGWTAAVIDATAVAVSYLSASLFMSLRKSESWLLTLDDSPPWAISATQAAFIAASSIAGFCPITWGDNPFFTLTWKKWTWYACSGVIAGRRAYGHLFTNGGVWPLRFHDGLCGSYMVMVESVCMYVCMYVCIFNSSKL